MDVSTILKNGLFQKISNTTYGLHWKSCTNSGFLLRFFSGEGGAAKNFLGGTPSKFSETNDSLGGGGGGQSFLSKMKFSHKSHN